MNERNRQRVPGAGTCFLLVVLGWALSAPLAHAGPGPGAPPKVIPYDGYLELDGRPVTTTALPMSFTLDDATNSANTWTESQDVAVYGGRFSVMLGGQAGNALPAWLFESHHVTVSIAINGVSLGGSQRIVPVPYAHWSGQASDFAVKGDLQVDGNVAASQVTAGQVTGTQVTAVDGLTGGSLDLPNTSIDSAGAIVNLGPITNEGDVALGTANNGRLYITDEWDSNKVGTHVAQITSAPVADGPWGEALMISGNENATGVRRVQLFEDVQTAGHLIVGREAAHKNLTVTGNLHIGTVTKTCPVANECSCDSGTYIIAGGTQCPDGTYLKSNYPSGSTRWIGRCIQNSLHIPLPGTIHLICGRIAP